MKSDSDAKVETFIISILCLLLAVTIIAMVIYEGSHGPTIMKNAFIDMNGDGILDFVEEAKVFISTAVSAVVP